jgi:hypothetical protein
LGWIVELGKVVNTTVGWYSCGFSCGVFGGGWEDMAVQLGRERETRRSFMDRMKKRINF